MSDPDLGGLSPALPLANGELTPAPPGNGAKVLATMIQNAGSYIASADSKATGLLAVSGALLALLVALAGSASSAKPDAPSSPIIQYGFALFAVLLALSVAASASVLLPRTDRAALLLQLTRRQRLLRLFKRDHAVLLKEASLLPTSPTYFGEVKSVYELKKIATTGISTEELSQDYVEQAFVIAQIAKKKLRWMQVSVWFLLASLVVLLSVIGMRLFCEEENAEQNRTNNPPEQTAQPSVSSDH